MTRFFAIARNAFVEAVRRPVYGVLILVTFAVLILDLPLSMWTLGRGIAEHHDTDQQMMINLGLSTLLVSGLLIAAFSASGVLSREIEEKTILTVLSKPVARPVVVLGKFAGVAAALVVAYWLCSLVFLLTVRHKVMPSAADPYDFPVIVLGCSAFAAAMVAALFCNYFFGWCFASSAVGFGTILLSAAMAVVAFIGKGWKVVPFGEGISPDLLVALVLILFAVLIFVAVAVAASTRLGQVMTLLVCFAFFFIGSISQYLFERFEVAYYLWTNLTFFYALDALAAGKSIPAGYVGLTAAYAACHIIAILAIGMALFQRRELTAQAGSAAVAAPPLVSLLAWAGRGGALVVAIVAMALPANFADLGLLKTIALRVGLAVMAVFGWLLWGWFGRGVKWTYFLAIVLTVLGVLGGVAMLFVPGLRAAAQQMGMGRFITGFVASALTLLILLLPRTRHHFGVLRK